MLLYYHGQLSLVTRSCGLSYSQREIRYCAREYCSRPSQMLHQVTYDVVATLIRPNNREIRYCSREYCSRPSQMLHQVTYDVVATLIRLNNA
eukprot:scaffold26605_cov98-Skeletonema_dohrnii-CCMP3373.AAC.1